MNVVGQHGIVLRINILLQAEIHSYLYHEVRDIQIIDLSDGGRLGISVL